MDCASPCTPLTRLCPSQLDVITTVQQTEIFTSGNAQRIQMVRHEHTSPQICTMSVSLHQVIGIEIKNKEMDLVMITFG